MAWTDAARAASIAARRAHAKGAKARTERLSKSGFTPEVMAKYSAKFRKTNATAKEALAKINATVSARRGGLVDLTKMMDASPPPASNLYFGKPLTAKQMLAPKGSIGKYRRMGGDKRYKP